MRCHRPRFWLALAVLAPTWSSAQPAVESQELLRSVAHAPALAAAARRAAAARERVDAAGRLGDVELEGMGSRMVGPMNERATMWEVNVRQPLPKRGERAADRERAQAGVSLAEADYAMLAGEMAADTAAALAEAEGALARVRLMETQLGRFDAVLRSVEARIGAGTGRVADRLTVQSRVAALQLAIEEEKRLAADALADARGRLGLSPEAPLPSFAAPQPAEIQPEAAAALRLTTAQAAAADAQVKVARASSNPMTSVGVRFENERRAMGDENTLGVAFSSELPWRSRRYARAEVRAAEAERAAAQTDATAARYRISTALTRVERAERVATIARRLSSETLTRLHAEHEAATRAASVGGMTGESAVLHAVDILDKSTDTELQVLRAETAVRTARAELWRYVPASTFHP